MRSFYRRHCIDCPRGIKTVHLDWPGDIDTVYHIIVAVRCNAGKLIHLIIAVSKTVLIVFVLAQNQFTLHSSSGLSLVLK